jgi:hypothetical protein
MTLCIRWLFSIFALVLKNSRIDIVFPDRHAVIRSGIQVRQQIYPWIYCCKIDPSTAKRKLPQQLLQDLPTLQDLDLITPVYLSSPLFQLVRFLDKEVAKSFALSYSYRSVGYAFMPRGILHAIFISCLLCDSEKVRDAYPTISLMRGCRFLCCLLYL